MTQNQVEQDKIGAKNDPYIFFLESLCESFLIFCTKVDDHEHLKILYMKIFTLLEIEVK